MLAVPLAQPGHERRDVVRGHLADHGLAPGGEHGLVTLQVPAIGLQRVRGQATLNRQVVQVAVDCARQGGQLSTSLTGVAGRPCASATGRQVSTPS